MEQYSEVRRRPRVQTVNTEPSKTVQSDVFRTEIKHVLAKYSQVGIIESLRNVDLQFRDVTEFQDFADMMYQSKEAEKVFMSLPSKVREVFGHKMANWLDAAHDTSKLEALRPKLEELEVLARRDRRAPEPIKPIGQRREADGRFATDIPPKGGKE